MPDARTVTICPLQREDQAHARALILAGLEEHWGTLDPALNPDLNDIMRSYACGTFLVARIDGVVVGTGALMPAGDGVARVMRMSVAKPRRRRGIATRVLDALIVEAEARGCHTVVLETTETWSDAIAFYLHSGFTLTHHADGDAHFTRRLA